MLQILTTLKKNFAALLGYEKYTEGKTLPIEGFSL